MSGVLRYDETYAVELYDRVEMRLDGQIFDGEITKIHPRLGMVRVAFLDHRDTCRDGSPKRQYREAKRTSVRVPAVDVDLMERDG